LVKKLLAAMAFSHFAQQYQQFLILDGGDVHPEVKAAQHQFQYVSAQCKLEQMKETHVFLH